MASHQLLVENQENEQHVADNNEPENKEHVADDNESPSESESAYDADDSLTDDNSDEWISVDYNYNWLPSDLNDEGYDGMPELEEMPYVYFCDPTESSSEEEQDSDDFQNYAQNAVIDFMMVAPIDILHNFVCNYCLVPGNDI